MRASAACSGSCRRRATRTIARLGERNVARLTEPHEKALIRRVTYYPELLETAARALEPHQLAHYLRDLAGDFHTYYNAHTFIVDDVGLRNARLNLVAATRQVLENGLKLLGVSAPEKNVVARDYKHSKRRTGGSGSLSGIAGFVVGLALGLAVAVGVYLFDRRPAARLAQESAPMTRDEAPARGRSPHRPRCAGRGNAVRVLRDAAEVRSRHPGDRTARAPRRAGHRARARWRSRARTSCRRARSAITRMPIACAR